MGALDGAGLEAGGAVGAAGEGPATAPEEAGAAFAGVDGAATAGEGVAGAFEVAAGGGVGTGGLAAAGTAEGAGEMGAAAGLAATGGGSGAGGGGGTITGFGGAAFGTTRRVRPSETRRSVGEGGGDAVARLIVFKTARFGPVPVLGDSEAGFPGWAGVGPPSVFVSGLEDSRSFFLSRGVARRSGWSTFLLFSVMLYLRQSFH